MNGDEGWPHTPPALLPIMLCACVSQISWSSWATWYIILHNWRHRRKLKDLCTVYIWNFKPLLLFHFFFSPSLHHQSLAGGQVEACSAAQIACEWAWERSTLLKSRTTSKKTERLSPKCHVSLNESQQWLFLPVMATDNGMQNHSPVAHLHSNKPPTSCSSLSHRFSLFLTQILETENKLHFSWDGNVI